MRLPKAITASSTWIGSAADTDGTPDENDDSNTGAASTTEPTPAEAKAIADVNAALKVEGGHAWTPSFEVRGFGLDVHGALGEEAQAILQVPAKRRPSRQALSVGLCKRIAMSLCIQRMHV